MSKKIKNLKEKVVLQRIEKLKPYRKNARKHPEEQISRLAASIQTFGFIGVIVIDKDNVVVAGHARLEAARRLGLDTVPTLKIDHLDEKQINAFRIADNQIATQSEWDMAL